DDQNAGEVTFDDSTASLGETDVQGAIEALASATDNDTQYTAGNGLNLDGSNEFTAVASPDADNALDVRANGIYATDTNTEYTAGNGLNLDGSNEFTAVVDPAANNALSVSGSGLLATDDQNAGEVTFDDSTASLGETDVQGAIEALASATDNDTQYTAGNGLNLDGSNEFTAVVDPAANNALSVSASGLYATDTDDQNAGEVAFDDSTASLGETDVQGAIEALASATDNDTQYTAGNGLNLDGSNEFTAVASPDANNALDVRTNGIYATDTNTEYTAGNGLNLDGSNEFTAVVDPAANNALSVSASGLYATDTDDQNAGEVAFDDSTASLGETDVQGAIEALAGATDNDTQYTAGNGLNLDGSNEFTAVVDPAANNALSVSGSGLLATDDQNAGEVAFDDSTASLGETNVQGAIEALASATDNDTQYTAGNGLNLDGSNEFTAVASPDANNALDVRANGIYATDTNTEYTAGNGLNLDGSNEFTAVVDPAANNALSVSGSGLYATDTDDQNAGEVAFDDSTASLGETDVQGAIEALASATDNDTQYTAGNGLSLDGSNEFTAVVDPAANNALSVSGSGLYATDTDDQNAGEVAFDDSTASLGETDVQGAIEALASATDNDTQYTAGNGLSLDGSNEFTAVASPDADNALDVRANGIYATDTNTEYTAGNGLNLDGSNEFTAVASPDANNALDVRANGIYATDTNTEYTAGNGLNLDGSNEFTAVASPDANNALDVRANGIYATDTNTEYTAGNGLNLDGSNEFTAVVDPAANNALSVSGSGLLATDDQNAGEVTFDDSTASLGETDVQGAIEALASATDNDTQYTAGNGLNLDGSNEFTAVASPDANNALDVRANGIYATDTNTEYTAGNGLNLDGSNEFTAVVDPAANNALSVSGSGLLATDDQNSDEVNNVASSIDLNGDSTVDAADIIDVDGDGVVDSTVQDVIEAITPITSKAARIFYPPSIAVDASSVVSGATIDLYQQYLDQYGMTLPSSAKSTSAPAAIPTYTRAELYYYVTYYDPTVFSNVNISDTGVMTYNVDAPPADYNSLINVVFVVK
ncbi:hypothetical protein HPE56_14665, partial [Maribacter sp. ANRC-HE7]